MTGGATPDPVLALIAAANLPGFKGGTKAAETRHPEGQVLAAQIDVHAEGSSSDPVMTIIHTAGLHGFAVSAA